MERNRNAPMAPGPEELSGLRGVILIARFVCELAMLAALAFWGYVVGEGVWAWLLGLAAPAPVRVAIELVLYAAAAAGLVAAGQPVAAVVLGVAGLVTSVLNEVQERRAGPDVRRRQEPRTAASRRRRP
jgi:hypothetical protein